MSDGILSWVKYAREVEIHKAGNAQGLIDWYNNGADGQINWGSEGDFAACVAIAGKHIDNPEGFCQLRHIDATGAPAGHASGEIAKGDLMGHKFHGNQFTAGSLAEKSNSLVSGGEVGQLANLPRLAPKLIEGHLDVANAHTELAQKAFGENKPELGKAHLDAAAAHLNVARLMNRAVQPDAPNGSLNNAQTNAQLANALSQKASELDGGVKKGKATDEPDYTKLISDRKGEPSDQDLYNQVKADARKKFDVYPSAVANGWVVQEYKRRGGTYHKPVTKGDVAGHPFHGNQWEQASALGERRSNLGMLLEPGDRENKAEIDAVAKGHLAAAKAHMSAAQEAVKSKDYALAQKHFEASVAHSKAADETAKLAKVNAKMVSVMGGKFTEEKWATVPADLKSEWAATIGNSNGYGSNDGILASQEASGLTRAIAAGR